MPTPKKHLRFTRVLCGSLLLLGVLAIVAAALGWYWWWVNRLDPKLLDVAFSYYIAHAKQLGNRRYLTVVDFNKPSFAKRMHIVDLETGEVSSYLVAHGSAQQGGNLYVPQLSNVPNSHASSVGFMRTGEEYRGSYGRSLRLDGLESRNSNVRNRAIVIHPAWYVGYRAVWANLLGEHVPRIGETYGCLAVSPDAIDALIDKLKGGSLIYVHARGL